MFSNTLSLRSSLNASDKVSQGPNHRGHIAPKPYNKYGKYGQKYGKYGQKYRKYGQKYGKYGQKFIEGSK